MPSLPITLLYVAFTKVSDATSSGGKLTWTPGGTSMYIERPQLPRMEIRVDREVQLISYTITQHPTISVELIPCRPEQCPKAWACSFGKGSQFRHTVTMILDVSKKADGLQYDSWLQWIGDASSPCFHRNISDDDVPGLLDSHDTAFAPPPSLMDDQGPSSQADGSAEPGPSIETEALPPARPSKKLPQAPKEQSKKKGGSKTATRNVVPESEDEVEMMDTTMKIISVPDVEHVGPMVSETFTKTRPMALKPYKSPQYEKWDMVERQISSLNLGEDLNGDIVDFALSILMDKITMNQPDLVKRIGIMSPTFYALYHDPRDYTDEQRYLKAENHVKWNIFELDFLVIPINSRAGNHWNLVVLKKPKNALKSDGDKAKIYVLDSIRTIVPEHLIGEMKNFLYHEAKLRYNLALDIDHFDIFLPHVPQQPNSCDCGLYTIHFAQVFASDPDFYAALIEFMQEEATTMDIDHALPSDNVLKSWKARNMTEMRVELKQLLLKHKAVAEKLVPGLERQLAGRL